MNKLSIAQVPLREVCNVISGATPKTGEARFWGGAIPWATPKDLSSLKTEFLDQPERSITEDGLRSCAASILPKNSVMLSSRAPIGLVAINTRPMATNQGFKSLVPDNSKVESKFLYHWLRANKERLQYLGNGATFKEISKAVVERIEIPLPPLDEQRRIASILDKADALRRERKRTLELLDGLTQSIFLEMFGDPVANSKALKSRSLGELDVDMSYGPRFYNEKYSDDGIRIVRITDLSDTGHLKFEDMPQLTLPAEEIDRHRSLPGDILFARTGATVGKVALISEDDPPNIPGAYFIRLRFPNFIHPAFAASALRSRSIQRIVFEGSRQSAQQNFSGPGLRRLPFLVPNSDDQRRFAERVNAVRSKIKQVGKHGEALDSLFASLQSRAFSGRL